MTLLTFFLILITSSITFLVGVAWGYGSADRDSLRDQVEILSQYIKQNEDDIRGHLDRLYKDS